MTVRQKGIGNLDYRLHLAANQEGLWVNQKKKTSFFSLRKNS